jgi:hypothetical protein
MEIIEKDFKLEYDEGCHKFDLYLLKIVNAKSDEKRREEFKLEGYSMNLSSALSIVIKERLAKKQDIYSISQYIKEFTKEINELKIICNEI